MPFGAFTIIADDHLNDFRDSSGLGDLGYRVTETARDAPMANGQCDVLELEPANVAFPVFDWFTHNAVTVAVVPSTVHCGEFPHDDGSMLANAYGKV